MPCCTLDPRHARQMTISNYYDLDSIRQTVERGGHRGAVGGMWEEVGLLTFRYLVAKGLRPEMKVLDVGCGCLRVGIHLVDFLDSGNYFGIDLSEDLLEAGYQHELVPLGLQTKVPRGNLLCDGEFAFDRLPTDHHFDVAVAQSLFTHLPLNHIRLCMTNLTPVMVPGGSFHATLFHCPDDAEWQRPLLHDRGGITTHPARDPYHYRAADFRHAIHGLPWSVTEPADWEHPRDQAIVTFERLRSAPASARTPNLG